MEVAPATWRPVLGFLALRFRLDRVGWKLNATYILAVPFVFFVWGSSLEVNRADPTRLLTGILVLSCLVAVLRQVGRAVASDLGHGRWRLLGTTEITPGGYLLGQLLNGLWLSVLPLLLVGVASALGKTTPPASPAWLVPYFLLVATSTAWGAGIAAAPRSMQTANGLITLATVTLAVFCPLLYPPERVPGALANAIALLPPSLACDAMARLWVGGQSTALALVGLAGWAVASSAWASRSLSRALALQL